MLTRAFLMIFWRFPITLRRFTKIFQNCSEGQANIPQQFPKMSKDFQRFPKTFGEDPKVFRLYTNKFKYNLRDKLDISEIIVITSEDMERDRNCRHCLALHPNVIFSIQMIDKWNWIRSQRSTHANNTRVVRPVVFYFFVSFSLSNPGIVFSLWVLLCTIQLWDISGTGTRIRRDKRSGILNTRPHTNMGDLDQEKSNQEGMDISEQEQDLKKKSRKRLTN